MTRAAETEATTAVLVILLAGLAGAALGARFGMWWALGAAGIAATSVGVYLLVHRLRYGRWSP